MHVDSGDPGPDPERALKMLPCQGIGGQVVGVANRAPLVGKARELAVGAIQQHRDDEDRGAPGTPFRITHREGRHGRQPGGDTQGGQVVGRNRRIHQRPDADSNDAVNPGVVAHGRESLAAQLPRDKQPSIVRQRQTGLQNSLIDKSRSAN